MWEPRRLRTVWAFTACYWDSFTFFYLYFIYYLFNDAVSSLDYMASNGKTISEIERMWVEAVVAWYPERTEGNHENLHSQ
jgi:hypothetical protein